MALETLKGVKKPGEGSIPPNPDYVRVRNRKQTRKDNAENP